jgi:hypothetical protein
VFAVTATAAVPLLARGGFGPDAHTPAWVLAFSVAGPLPYAAWFVGAESEELKGTFGAPRSLKVPFGSRHTGNQTHDHACRVPQQIP